MWHRWGLVLLPAVAVLAACAPAPSDSAAQFSVLAIDRPGCDSGEFRLAVVRAGLGGGNYVVRTQVTLGNSVYMDERATIFRNAAQWTLYEDFSSLRRHSAWFPLPAGERRRVDSPCSPVGRTGERDHHRRRLRQRPISIGGRCSRIASATDRRWRSPARAVFVRGGANAPRAAHGPAAPLSEPRSPCSHF